MNKKQKRSRYIKRIKELEFEKLDMRNFYVSHSFKNKYHKSKNVDDLILTLELCQREFNEKILKFVRKYPNKLINTNVLNNLELEMINILNKLPTNDNILELYWDKYYKAINECFMYITE